MHSIVKVITPAATYDLTTVEQANAFLDLTPSTDGDAILAAQITAASLIIARQCDRIFAAEDVVETFVARWGECIQALRLERFPNVEIDAIDDNGQTLAMDQYDLDPAKGIVWRRPDRYYWDAHWYPGSFRIAVSYTGGYNLPDEAPPDLALACLALIKEQRFAQLRGDPTIRSLQHGDSSIFYQQGSQAYAIGQAALPPSVSQLIAPYKEPAAA